MATASRAAAGRVLLRGIDANLGVEGLPQSATGQTTLLTGFNAAAALGHHVTAFPGARLQQILLEHSIFKQVVASGREATFANAFSRHYFELVERRKMRYSASVWAVRAAELPLRDVAQLREGDALTWDITREHLSEGSEKVEAIPARQAGAQLALLASRHHFTMFETFLTDLVGHGRTNVSPVEVVERIDGLLAGVVSELTQETSVILTSDHGNFEVLSHRRHTRNPVPLLAIGRDAGAFATVRSLIDVAPRVMWLLNEEDRAVLTLAYGAGMSHAEIARVVDKPLGSVKAQIHRAKLKLNQWLDDNDHSLQTKTPNQESNGDHSHA